MSPHARAWLRRAAITPIALLALCGCRAPLPEVGSPAEQLYAYRCGQCHRPHNPHSLTASMWELQVPMNEEKMRKAGIPPLTAEERQMIVDYLKRNAGTQ